MQIRCFSRRCVLPGTVVVALLACGCPGEDPANNGEPSSDVGVAEMGTRRDGGGPDARHDSDLASTDAAANDAHSDMGDASLEDVGPTPDDAGRPDAAVDLGPPAEPASISASPTSMRLASLGARRPIEVTVYDVDSNPIIPSPMLTWTSDDPAIATVDGVGVVTAVSDGVTAVNVSVGNLETTVDIAVERFAGDCNRYGWCWENPTPFGMHLADVWAAAEDDVWAVGRRGTVVRWDGTRWGEVDAGTTEDLAGVWGSGPDDVWLVGAESTILRWDGTSVGSMNAPSNTDYSTVHGLGADDVWVAGFGTHDLAHWDGTSWDTYPNPLTNFRGLTALFAVAPGDVWAGSEDGLLRWDGVQWIDTGSARRVTELWGAPGALFAGHRNGLDRWDGTTWNPVAAGPVGRARAITGTAQDDVWVAEQTEIWNFDGTAWTSSPVADSLSNLAAASPTRAWGVGAAGLIYDYDGTAWTRSSGDAVEGNFRVAWPTPSGDVWFLGSHAVRWSHGELLDHSLLLGGFSVLDPVAVWGASDDDIWVVSGNARTMHFSNGTWTLEPTPLTFETVNDVWGTSPNNVYAVASSFNNVARIMRWSGAGWSIVHTFPVSFGDSLIAIGGTGPSDIWAAGERGMLWHFDGSSWTEQTVPDGLGYSFAYDIVETPSGTLLMGTSAGLLEYANGVWSAVPGVTGAIRSITISPTMGTWAIEGSRRESVRLWFDDPVNGWTTVEAGAGQGLNHITTTDTDVWLVGTDGAILRRN